MQRFNPQGGSHGLFLGGSSRVSRWSEIVLVVAGAIQAASLAWPLSVPNWLKLTGLTTGQPMWYLPLLTLALLVCQLARSASAQRAAWLGWCFATAWLATTFAWLFTSMHTYGGLAAPLAVLGVLALAAALALYSAAAAWIFWHLARGGPMLAALCFSGLWMLAEMGRGLLLTGFGWGAVGYTQLQGPLASWFAWLGIYGVSALVAGIAALLGLLICRPMFRSGLGLLMVFGLLSAGPYWLGDPSGSSTGSLAVSLLQGNIAQDEKFDQSSGVPKALLWYGRQLMDSRSSLVVTPETALALLPGDLPAGYWQALQERFNKGEQAALIGMPMGSFSAGYTNSVVGLKPGQASPWQYDKHHLVPFGEFIPPMFRWFTDLMNIPLGDFNRGPLPQATFDWKGQRLAMSICYENLFSEELAAQFTHDATAPTVLVNISNLGWFGEHVAMDQHLAIARVRALEFARPFVMATNTGHTAIVNYKGQVTHQVANHQIGVLSAAVEGRTGVTPYAHWVSRWGQWPLAVVAVFVIALAWAQRKR